MMIIMMDDSKRMTLTYISGMCERYVYQVDLNNNQIDNTEPSCDVDDQS